VFCRESLTMQPLGFSEPAARPVCCARGFSHLGRQTESEGIPLTPQNPITKKAASFFLRWLRTPTTTNLLHRKFPGAGATFSETLDHASMDEECALLVAEERSIRCQKARNTSGVFCLRGPSSLNSPAKAGSENRRGDRSAESAAPPKITRHHPKSIGSKSSATETCATELLLW